MAAVPLFRDTNMAAVTSRETFYRFEFSVHHKVHFYIMWDKYVLHDNDGL